MGTPCHRDPLNRSHTDKTILLLRLGERYVPIAEQAVLILPEEDRLSHKSASDNERGGRSGKKEKDRSLSDRGEKSGNDKDERTNRSNKERSERENRSISEKEEGWNKSLHSVDSMKSLAGIPSISGREEIADSVVELRASLLE